MANYTTSQIREVVGKEGYSLHVVGGAAAIPEGVMVAQLAADGTLVSGSTALSGPVIGVSTHSAAIGAQCAVETERDYLFDNDSNSPCSAATLIGAAVFCKDNHTVAAASGGTLFYAGTFRGMDPSGKVRVHISPLQPAPSADATEIDELQANAVAVKSVDIPFLSARLADGTVLPAFVNDAAASSPGIIVVDSKAFGIRWNNHATPTAVWTHFGMPNDIDTTKNATLEFLVSKSGATVGDAVKITVAAFNQVAAALHDADADFGGDTGALVGNATAKTVTKLSRTLTATDLAAAGSGVSMSFKPKDGTLGTDDAIVTGVRLTYTPKMLAA